MLIAALFTTANTQKQPKCPSTEEWIKKMCIYIHTHIHTHTHKWHITQPSKKNEIMPFAATWMDLEIIILSKSKTNHMILLICGI